METFPTRILLATDGSEDSAGGGISRTTGSELHIVHAWRSLPYYAYPSLVFEAYHPPYEEDARMGSVSTKVLRVARGPLLVCPPPLKVA